MTAPVAMTDAIPLLVAGGLTGQNNSKDIRKGLLQGLVSSGAAGFCRPGVLPHAQLVGALTEPSDLKVLELAVPGQAVRINGGDFLTHRGAVSGVDEGPYLGFMSSGPTQMNLPAASGANARYDLIVARVWDKNIAADSALSTHGPYFDVISGALGALNFAGVRGAAGALPVLPDGCVELAAVARAVSDNVVSQAEITDMRRGTSWFGAPRVLFPFDIVNIATDVGYQVGELRINAGSMEIWDSVNWRLLDAGGLVGGRDITGGNNLTPAINTVETQPLNMNSTFAVLAPNRRYLIHTKFKFATTVASSRWLCRIKADTAAVIGITGNQVDEFFVTGSADTGVEDTFNHWCYYTTGATAETLVFKLTVVRQGGTGDFQAKGGGTGSTNLVGVWVRDVSKSGKTTVTAS